MKALWIFIFFVIGAASLSEASSLRPFTSDGCSSSPDGMSAKLEFLQCCVQHDLHYWKGGTAEQKQSADLEFKSCLDKNTNPTVTSIYYNSVRVGGNAKLGAPWSWGYGWTSSRAYAPHTPSESLEIEKMTPDLSLPLALVRTYFFKSREVLEVKKYFEEQFQFAPEEIGLVYRFVWLDGSHISQVVSSSKRRHLLLTSRQCPQGYYLVDTTDFQKNGAMEIQAFGSCQKIQRRL